MSDVAELRELARRMRELASQARGCAGRMRDAQGVDFVSKAAERYRNDLRNEANGADNAAKELDDAARALMDHAHHVEQNLARIHAIERWFGDRLDDARHEVSGAVETISHTASDILEHAPRAPSPGSPDWLGQQVLVSGHSQGGIAAMALARDPRGFTITNVVTAGSPVAVAALHPPPHVHVLSIEHSEDPVTHLDGGSNPELPNWTTITGDVGYLDSVQDDPFNAHDAGLYGETADQIDKQRMATLPPEFSTTSPGASATQFDYGLSAP